MKPFNVRVIDVICLVSYGKVVSYGQVALYAGLPRLAREVGWILHSTTKEIPWWRVVNKQGKISLLDSRRDRQKKLLEMEGVVVLDDFTISMKVYRFYPTHDQLEKLQLSEAYIRMINSYVL